MKVGITRWNRMLKKVCETHKVETDGMCESEPEDGCSGFGYCKYCMNKVRAEIDAKEGKK